VCYSKADIDAGLCPINYLKVKKTPPAGKFEKVNEEWYLAFDKNGTGLPIVSTKLSAGQPCLKPSEINHNNPQARYELENSGF